MKSPSLFTLRSCTLAVVLAPAIAAQAAPRINEFLASNQGGLLDEDSAASDWIELHNPDGAAVDLSGWSLTDSANPTKWVFPAGVSLPAGGYLVVFASGKDRRVVGSNLHTNFSLSAGGEFLGLYAPGNAVAVDSLAPTYPVQAESRSYGWLDLGPGPQRVFFTTPSPGTVNLAANAPALPVAFSLTSRTFANGTPLSLTLANPSATASIRYTLDRTVPTAASPLYAGTPLNIATSTRVRARAFETGRPDGPVGGEIFLAMDTDAMNFTSTLPIVLQHSWNSGHPSTVAPTGTTPEDTKKAAWFVFMPKGVNNLASMANLPDLATPSYFERRGSSTFGSPKYSMTMGAVDEAEAGKDVSVFGFPSNDDWVLHAPYQFDRCLIHNDLSYELSNKNGRYAVRTKHVELFQSVTDGVVGGAMTVGTGANTGSLDYYGIYSFMEKISRGARRVDVEDITPLDNTAPNVQGGYIFKIDRLDNGDLGVTGGGRAWPLVFPKEFTAYPAHLAVATVPQKTYLAGKFNDMFAALQAPNFMDATLGYAAHVDVDAAIDHHLFNVAAKNADGMRLSGYWHKTRFGKLVMGPLWDFDRAQGSSDGRDLNPNTWRGDVSDFGTDFFHSTAVMNPNYFQFMFQDPNFWTKWLDRWTELRRTTFATAEVNAVIDSFQEQLDPGDAVTTPAKRNNTRWSAVGGFGYRAAAGNTPGTNGTFRGEIAWLKSWWQSRMAFMDGQFIRPTAADVPSGPVAPSTVVTLSTPGQTVAGTKVYFTTDGTDPRAPSTAKETPPPALTLATLVADNATVRAIVPTLALNTTYGTNWRGADLNMDNNNQNDFDDSTWYSVTPGAGLFGGVGYDDNLTINYLPFISLRFFSPSQTTVINPVPVAGTGVPTAVMRNVNASSYIRYPFTVSSGDATHISGVGKRLKILVRYDDGYVCWLNGTEVARSSSVPAATVATWNTGIPNTHDDNAAIVPEEIDITTLGMAKLHAGENVLAFQLINGGATPNTSSDAVLQAKMIITGPAIVTPYPANIAIGATEYTTPLTITVPTVIKTRALTSLWPSDPPTAAGGGGIGDVPNGSSWSGLSSYYYFPGAAAASISNLTISEVNYHPMAPTAAEITAGYLNANDFEYVRLTNTGTDPVDLSGIYFSNGLDFQAPAGLQNWLPAGQSVVVVENAAAFLSRYGSLFTVLGTFSGELDDGGEHIVLNAANGFVIADFTYGDAAPWPAEADGETSLLFLGGNPNDPTNWLPSLPPGLRNGMGYPAFQAYYFANTALPTAEQAALADADKDGLSNLVEYALGTHPGQPTADPFLPDPNQPGAFILRHRTGLTDVQIALQNSLQLTTWTPLSLDSTQELRDGTRRAHFTLPSAMDRKFIRFHAEVVP